MGTSLIPSLDAGAGVPYGAGANIAQPSDMTRMAPPGPVPQVEPEPQPGSFGHIQRVYSDAVTLLHMKGPNGKRKYTQAEVDEWIRAQPGVPARTFQHLARIVGQHAVKNPTLESRPEDLAPSERGALARITLFGHSALPFTDEIAGLVSAASGRGYKKGRDENRAYLQNARLSANPGVLNPEVMGPLAAGFATGGETSLKSLLNPRFAWEGATTAPGLVRSAATGAGFGAGYTVGDMPEFDRAHFQDILPQLLINTAGGTALGGSGALLGQKATAFRRPGVLHAEDVLRVAGGEPGLERAVAASGSATPMLSELQTSSFGRLGQELRRTSAEATTIGQQRVAQQLEEVQAAKHAFDPFYEQLHVPVNDARIRDVMNHPRIRPILQDLMRDGVVGDGPLTGRALEDIRQELMHSSNRAYNSGDPRVGKLLKGKALQLQSVLDDAFQEMPEVRKQLQPLITREKKLLVMQRQLNRAARGTGITPENKVTAHSMIHRELGAEAFQRQHRRMQQLADLLYRPGSVREHLNRLQTASPWYRALGRYTLPAASSLPANNPFFPQQPQE